MPRRLQRRLAATATYASYFHSHEHTTHTTNTHQLVHTMGRTTTASRLGGRRAYEVDSMLRRKPQHEEVPSEDVVFSSTPQFEQEDQTMDQEDTASVPTASAVRAFDGPGGYSYFSLPLHRAPNTELKSKEFVIPRTPTEIAAAAAEATEAALREMQQDDYEDDISILTEFSGMDEEEDASSQVTAGTETRTVVTTTTGSTTIPTRNACQLGISATSSRQQYEINKRRNAVMDAKNGLPPLDNSQYKRRRML